MLFRDLCQHTPSDHSDYRILRESLKAMSDFIASTHDPTTFREVSTCAGFVRCSIIPLILNCFFWVPYTCIFVGVGVLLVQFSFFICFELNFNSTA